MIRFGCIYIAGKSDSVSLCLGHIIDLACRVACDVISKLQTAHTDEPIRFLLYSRTTVFYCFCLLH